MFRWCLRGVGWFIRLRGLFHRLSLLGLLLFASCLSLGVCGGERGVVEAEVEEVFEVCGLLRVVVGVGEGTQVGTVVWLLAEEGREEEVLGGRGELIHNNC